MKTVPSPDDLPVVLGQPPTLGFLLARQPCEGGCGRREAVLGASGRYRWCRTCWGIVPPLAVQLALDLGGLGMAGPVGRDGGGVNGGG